MIEFLTALSLAIVIEGVLYALFPEGMRRKMIQVLEMSDGSLRTSGIIATIAGLGFLAILRIF